MRGLVFAVAVMGAGQACAQEWFTPETCRVTASDVAMANLPQGLATDLAQAERGIANPRGRLWKITTPDGQVSHLWGTYHTPHPLLLDLPQTFRDILDQARVVALEFDPIPDSRAESTASADTGWMWRTDGSWADWSFIPPDQMGWIKARMDAIGWGTGYLDQMTEAGLASLLLSDPCGDFLAGVIPGQDGYIAQQAFLAGAEVTGLQKWQDFGQQLMAPERAEEVRAVIVLYASYLGPESADGDGLAMSYRLYLEGRTAELGLWADDWLAEQHGRVEGERLAARAEGYLLVERNVIFVHAAMPLVAKGGAVIAVGAGHLAGRTGMVEMLRAEGLRVERVMLPGEVP